MRIKMWQVISIAAVVTVAAPACSKKKEEKPAEQTTTTTAASSTTKATTATTKVPTTGTTIAGGGAGGIRQWASTASATTSYGQSPGSDWNASQATGAPNVPTDQGDNGCGDIAEAWASASHDTVDTLTLGYQNPVIPTAINIHETYNPGAVVKVVVSGPGGKSKTVFEGQPTKVTTCPRVLEVPVSGVDFAVDTVAITIDQTQIQSWAEIDAVELVGNASSSGPHA